MEEMRLKEIRKNERKSHIEIYSNAELYKEGSWLIRPIKTVVDLIPLFDKYEEINVLDLGCGVGRNCICIARNYYDRLCKIDCVNILDLAIEKLYANADEYGVTSNICGILSWTHYRILLQVKDEKVREWYEKEALQQAWSVKTLQRNVSSQYYYRMLQTQKKDLVENEMKELIKEYQSNRNVKCNN